MLINMHNPNSRPISINPYVATCKLYPVSSTIGNLQKKQYSNHLIQCRKRNAHTICLEHTLV